MILVAEFPCGKRLEFDVVLGIGCRQHDHARLGRFKEHSFKGGQAMRVKMLDHLDDGRSIIAL